MKRKVHSKSKTAIKFASGLTILGVALSGNAFAADKATQQSAKKPPAPLIRPLIHRGHFKSPKKLHKSDKGWDLGEGWLLTTTGGLSYVHPTDDSYWFKLSGAMRFDETIFMGSYRDKAGDFPSGANIRAADLYLDGGVGKDWEYTATLLFASGFQSKFGFGDTWIAYSGFMKNNQVFVGRVPGNWFGLDSANSTTWNPFLERSIQTSAFYPGDGLGVMTDYWWDIGGFTIAAMQPDQDQGGVIPGVRDRWHGTARLTLAPVHEEGDVWHFGVSGAYRELVSTVNGASVPNATTTQGGVAFATVPSARARNTAQLLNTTTGNQDLATLGLNIRANNVRLFNVEAARQCGSFMLEGEYTSAFVHRIGSSLGSLRFDGWNVQSRYFLTGESHEYDVRDGQFGSVKPIETYGAFEVAARYDFVDLNDKNVRGGSEHNVTLGLNWFINQQVRLSLNYIRASIHPANDALKRNLDIVGMRAQVRFK